ncbi:MAG: hypothetical protein U0350_38935 [Caldilineaceae bacterium]
MKQEITDELEDELRPHYDLRQLLKGGVRGKYVERYRSGTNLALLEPDLAQSFPTDELVNQALRHELVSEPIVQLQIPLSVLLSVVDTLNPDELKILHERIEEKLAA